MAACGKVTQIIEYSNGTIGVMTFYCHRWDCDHCRQVSKQEIINKIMKKSLLWYAVPIQSSRYQAIRKRIARADAKYAAIGSGVEILILTDKPVLEESKLLSKPHLEPLIAQYLDLESQYDYRHKRFRHSVGLFPVTQPINTDIHIKRKVAVDKPRKDVIAGLEEKGYFTSTNSIGSIEYMRPYKGLGSLDIALKNEVDKVRWVE
jgi:hypothetical protein